jgi:squalene-hopene/tetraprenyl-beta-curcumene cyclase
MTPSLQVTDALVAAAAKTARQSVEWFAANQHDSGYWWGDLTADTTLEADYILLQLWLYPPQHGSWNPPGVQQIDRAVRSIRERQLAEGGFNLFPDWLADVNASIKAYFALKVAGSAADARMVALRETILRLGGLQAANSYVKINLSLFGLYPRPHVPSIPPELILLGKVIYEMSSWTRAIVIPLSIVQALTVEPRAWCQAGFSLAELLVPGVSLALPRDDGFFNRRNTFLRIDKVFKLWERFGSGALRRRAIRKADGVDHGTDPLYGRVGGDLSADDVHDHGDGSAGICRGPSGPGRGGESVCQSDGGRRGAVFLPALFFGGVGYGDCLPCAGRERHGGAGAADAGGRVAADQRGPAEG